jgi:hypothetical protein
VLGGWLLVSAGFILSGCVGGSTMSNYARTGDTFSVSLASTTDQVTSEIMKKENVAAVITDIAGGSYPVKVRNVFRVYSDPTSTIYIDQPGSVIPPTPFQGEWMAAIDIVDPVSGQQPPLAPGKAKLSITSSDLWSDVQQKLAAIDIEILPGTGSANPVKLDILEPLPQVEVAVSGTPGQKIGGGSFTFSYDPVVFFADPQQAAKLEPRVLPATNDRNVQLAWTRTPQADGTVELRVMISNPKGFTTDNFAFFNSTSGSGLSGGESMLRALRFMIAWGVPNSTVTNDNWQSHLRLVSARYIDLNGSPMPELTPVMTKIR